MLPSRFLRPTTTTTTTAISAISRTAALFTTVPHPTTKRFFHATKPTMTVHEVKTESEFKDTVKEHKIVLLDCFAEWCGPCKAISPVLEKLSNHDDYKDKIHFIKFDVDELGSLSQELGIRSLPTFLLFKDGEKQDQFVGANPTGLTNLLKQWSA